jgi:hypothetical protein
METATKLSKNAIREFFNRESFRTVLKLDRKYYNFEAEENGIVNSDYQLTEEALETIEEMIVDGEYLKTKYNQITLCPKVGMGVTLSGYSDCHPAEIIEVVRAKNGNIKHLVIRGMDSELDPEWKPEMIAGGFAGHCTNQRDQKWILTSNPENHSSKVKLVKDGWKSEYGKNVSLGKAVKFYDYNF